MAFTTVAHAPQSFINTSKTFQRCFPLAVSVCGTAASTKPSPAKHHIRRYALEWEFYSACRVATMVSQLEQAETNKEKIRLREKEDPLQGDVEESGHSFTQRHVSSELQNFLLVSPPPRKHDG